MNFNVSKCKVIYFDHKNPKISYKIGGKVKIVGDKPRKGFECYYADIS